LLKAERIVVSDVAPVLENTIYSSTHGVAASDHLRERRISLLGSRAAFELWQSCLDIGGSFMLQAGPDYVRQRVTTAAADAPAQINAPDNPPPSDYRIKRRQAAPPGLAVDLAVDLKCSAEASGTGQLAQVVLAQCTSQRCAVPAGQDRFSTIKSTHFECSIRFSDPILGSSGSECTVGK
jgi:hypothetical protein